MIVVRDVLRKKGIFFGGKKKKKTGIGDLIISVLFPKAKTSFEHN